VQESYPNLRSDSYDLIAQIEKAKDRNAKYRSELSSLELPEVDKVRERKRGQMQGYLNKWTDYYAELYELNPEMFAAMPTKEFMEHKAEFTGLEQARVAQERYEQGCASVADTLRRVLVEADDVENNPRPKDNREGVEDPYHIWFDHQFLRNDYRVTTMLKTFHGYDYDLSDAFAKNRNGYDSLMLDYVDTITSGKTEFYTREGYKKISPEERALWEETEAYFNDYAKKRLDVTPRQLIEGYTTIVEKSKDEIQARLDETNAKIAEFKQRFARQQEGQTGEVFENN